MSLPNLAYHSNDLVSRKPGINENTHRRIMYVRLPATAVVTLADMCDILRWMSENSPNYKLLSKQCYWFCSMFIRKLELHPGMKLMTVEAKDHKDRGI